MSSNKWHGPVANPARWIGRAVACCTLALHVGMAYSQSGGVTIGGRIDLAAAKPVGTSNKQLLDNAGSRLFFRGAEDLGGGLRAIFVIETRFDASTGVSSDPYWNGESVVGIQGAFGRVLLGRTYVSAWQLAQNQIDPFGGDTIAQLRGVGLQIGPARLRVPDQIRYDYQGAGFNVAFDVAEAAPAVGPDRSYSFGANASFGPVFVAVGHDDPGGANDKLTTVGARFTFGPVVARAGASQGTTNTGAKVRGQLVGASWQLGAGQLLFGLASNKTGSATMARKIGVGYHHWLSKRTKVYTDVARDSRRPLEKTGYDLGVQHNF